MALRLTPAEAEALCKGRTPISSERKSTKSKNSQRASAGSGSKSPPQATLFQLLKIAPETKLFSWEWERQNVVPGRRFSVDIALWFSPLIKLALEIDGFSVHGRNLEGYYRDREKDWLLELNDWVCLRIPAGMVSTDPNAVLMRVSAMANRLYARHIRILLFHAGAKWHRQWLKQRRGKPVGEFQALTFYQPGVPWLTGHAQ